MAGTTGRSAKGEIVDFDMMRIKQQLADAPPRIDVSDRAKMIKAKRKRQKVTKEQPTQKDDA